VRENPKGAATTARAVRRFRPTRDHLALAAVYALALAVRLPLRGVAAYFDEGAFHYFAIHYWHAPANVTNVYGYPADYPNYLWFWERPLFYFLMSPAAHVSFAAYRLLSILLAAALPVAAILVLRAWNVRRPIAWTTGAVIALSPQFLRWGVLVYMDPVMTLAVGLGLWSWTRRRTYVALAFLAAAVMIKMTAVLVLVHLFAWATLDGLREGRVRVWPLRLPANVVAHALAVPLGLAPYLYVYSFGYGFPGSTAHGNYAPKLVEMLFFSAYVIPILLVGLAWPRTRRWSLLAGLLAGSFLYIHLVGHRNVEDWYAVLPAYMSLLATALVFDEAANRARPLGKTVWTWTTRATPAAFAILALLLILLPASAAKADWTRPVSHLAEPSLAELFRSERARDQGYEQGVRALGPGPGRTVFVVDVYFSKVLHPVATSGGTIRYAGTWPPPRTADLGAWSSLVEATARRTLLEKNDHALNLALRDTYGGCTVYDEPAYQVIEGPRCAGRDAALRENYRERLAQGHE